MTISPFAKSYAVVSEHQCRAVHRLPPPASELCSACDKGQGSYPAFLQVALTVSPNVCSSEVDVTHTNRPRRPHRPVCSGAMRSFRPPSIGIGRVYRCIAPRHRVRRYQTGSPCSARRRTSVEEIAKAGISSVSTLPSGNFTPSGEE